ncbi:MAG: tetratricopeptide repeat protein [Candidatus Delongbacteria bacterium]|jgi:class 3 adenylate cyclase/tetratricopeptide (TPR) repeat protein|nr:tetratricopeptide repeat protein [Candidatus Delongbacteria bacterium]
MQNLVPEKIVRNFIDNKFTDEFDCFSMFVDISGFTSTTEALMKHGQEGAEVLSDILKYLFDTIVNAVYDHGGYVTKYAGDAFTAIFEIKDGKKTTALRALNAAKITNQFFEDNKIFDSRFGEFDFGVKVGLAYGNCICGIVGSKNEKTYYFSGDSVDLCAMAEHNADKGDIWMHESFYNYTKSILTKTKSAILHDEKFYQVIKTKDFKVSHVKRKKVNVSKEVIYQLAGKLEAEFPIGEFRDIISVFISFSGDVDLQDMMEQLYDLKSIYGASHPVLDFGDKGGNILLFFGAPISYENNIQRALNFILRLVELRTKDVKIRAGIAKGVVYCGFSGADIRHEFTSLGNTVNQSARFMMQAEWDQVLMGKEFISNENFVFDHTGDIKYKGIENLIPTFNLVGKAEIKDIFFKGEFIGRKKDKQKLHKFLSPLDKNKNCGIVYIDGEAGIGKSRLVNKIRSELIAECNKRNDSINWFYFSCDEIIRSPYNPLNYFFNRHFDLNEDDTKERNSDRFNSHLDEIIRNIADPKLKSNLDSKRDYISYFLNLKISNSDILVEEPNERQNNTTLALIALFKVYSEKSKLVLEIDNAGFIDSDSLKFFKRLSIELKKLPFVTIFNSRLKDNGEKYDFGFERQKRIRLKNLTIDDFNELAKSRLKAKTIPNKTLKTLQKKSHKNPLYLEQMIHYIVDNDLIDKKMMIKQDADLPDGLNKIVIARIDKLKQHLKDILKAASVLGNDFSIEVLSYILSDKYNNIEKYLTDLENEDILILVSEVNYLFKYAVIRDAIYDMQLRKIVRELHEIAADSIEKINKDNIESHYNILAYHYDLAENVDKSMEYLSKAGRKARNDYQNDLSIKHFNRWIYFASKKAGIGEEDWKSVKIKGNVDLINNYVQINFERFYFYFSIFQDIDKSESVIDTSQMLAEKINDEFLNAQIYVDKSQLLSYQGKIDESNKCLEYALKIFIKLDNPNKISLAYENLGKNYLTAGKMDKALDCFNSGLKYAEQIKNNYSKARMRAKHFGLIGIIYDYSGQFDKALENYHKQLEIAEKENLKLEIASAIANIGIVYHLMGDLNKAREYYERKLKMSEEIGKRNELAQSLNNIGFLYKDLGEYKKAISHHKQSYKISKELSDYNTMSSALINLALVFKTQKNYKKAEQEFEKGLKIAEKYDIKHTMAEALTEMGELYLLTDQKVKAIEYVDKGLKISEEIGFAEYIEKGKSVKEKLK